MTFEQFEQKLSKYLPKASIPLIYHWLTDHRIKLKISKPRSTKLGDFRVKQGNTPATISVNGNLNAYSFLITMTHEIAHLKDFEERKTLRNAHGATWKSTYSGLLEELVEVGSFPDDMIPVIRKHIKSPKAASCADVSLLEALRKYDEHESILLKELSDGAEFSISNGRRFRRGALRRTRYKCLDLENDRWYLVHGSAEVTPIQAKKI